MEVYIGKSLRDAFARGKIRDTVQACGGLRWPRHSSPRFFASRNVLYVVSVERQCHDSSHVNGSRGRTSLQEPAESLHRKLFYANAAVSAISRLARGSRTHADAESAFTVRFSAATRPTRVGGGGRLCPPCVYACGRERAEAGARARERERERVSATTVRRQRVNASSTNRIKHSSFITAECIKSRRRGSSTRD